MSIIYNARYRTHRNDILDGLMRVAGLSVFAMSVIVMTFSIYCWGI